MAAFDGHVLTSRREAAGLSRRDLARLVPCSPAAISRWESGDLPISGRAAALLEDALSRSDQARRRTPGRRPVHTAAELEGQLAAALGSGESQRAALAGVRGGTERKRRVLRQVLIAREEFTWRRRREVTTASALDVVRLLLVDQMPTFTEVRRALRSRELARDVAGYATEGGERVQGRLERYGECHWERNWERVGRGQLTRPVWRLHRGDVAAPTTPRSLSGDEVRAIRKGLKLTLALAGAAVGVSPGTFHDWEKRGSQEISRVHADGLEDKLKAAATKAVSAESKIRERCEQDVLVAAAELGEGTTELLIRELKASGRPWPRKRIADALKALVARGELELAAVIVGPRSNDGWRVPRGDGSRPADRIDAADFCQMIDTRPRGTELALAKHMGKSNSLLQRYRMTGVTAVNAPAVLEGLAVIDEARASTVDARGAAMAEQDARLLQLLAERCRVSLYEVHQELRTQAGWVARSLERLQTDGRVRAEAIDVDAHGRRRPGTVFVLASTPALSLHTTGPEVSGADVARARKSAGLTQAELAALLGLTDQNVSLWESGKQPVPPKHRPALRAALPSL